MANKNHIKNGWDFELPIRYIAKHLKDGKVSKKVLFEALRKIQDTIYIIKINDRTQS